MKGLAITSKGLEDTASNEIKEIIGTDCEISQGCVIFDFKNFEQLCLLCYKSQSIDRALCIVGDFEFGDFFRQLEKILDRADFDGWTKNYKTFRVECIRQGLHDFKSVDVEAKASGFILKRHKGRIKLDIKNPEIIFLFYIINNKCFFGIDFAGFELNKRSYKIFLHPGSLRATIAYALVRESGFSKEGVMLDPFSRDGVVAIEAALHASGFPHNYYKKERFAFLKLKLGVNFDKFFKSVDKKAKKPKARICAYDHMFKYVDYSRKNAKIAGTYKYIEFSRVELEWLDIKFKKESVDAIVTSLPGAKSADLDRSYNEFFYQSEYILKKDGRISIISRIPELAIKHAAKHNFKILIEREVWSGEQPLKMMLFGKNPGS